ncbi:MAG TPA: YggS family pyridoxal phosphate-dependent enzyme [Ignavibacteria bacterium]|nr:YggS family pyridoxal phosphate-dependent enzyme [Ignavibacteria bacterium]
MDLSFIAENYRSLKKNVSDLCLKAGRNPDEITIVAVTKTFPAEYVSEIYKCGLKDIGENKVQELVKKKEELSGLDVNWHLIGHLQTNKVKYIIDFVYLIHSVDSVKLASEIQKHAEKINRVIDILVQVNISEEATKSGVDADETKKLVEEINQLANIRIKGLMTIGTLTEDKEIIRQNFRDMMILFDDLKQSNPEFEYLSMGMTSDYDIAIEEGSNMIRVGSYLFGNRNYNN